MNENIKSQGSPIPEEVTNNVLRKLGFLGDSASALEAVLDPFHDFPIVHNGWPDVCNGSSLVQCFKRTFNIATPTVGSAYNFAVHITPSTIYHPMVAVDGTILVNEALTSGYSTSSATGFATPANPTVYPFGGVCVVSNTALETGTQTISATSRNCYSPFTDTPNTTGVNTDDAFRIVGCGFELVNTTAPLYQAGRIMTYRMDDPREQYNMVFAKLNDGVVPVVYGRTWTKLLRGTPSTQASADILPGSLLWHAREGAYVTAVMENVECPPYRPASGTLVLDSETNASIPNMVTAAPIGTAVNDARTYCVSQACHDSNLIPCGAIVEGLTAESTFTLTIKWYIETFPRFQSALITLAKPSASYDPLALAAYARAARLMPTGCPVSDNAKGDWWRKGLGMLKQVVGVGGNLARLIPNKEVQKVAKEADAITKILNAIPKSVPDANRKIKKASSKKRKAKTSKERVVYV